MSTWPWRCLLRGLWSTTVCRLCSRTGRVRLTRDPGVARRRTCRGLSWYDHVDKMLRGEVPSELSNAALPSGAWDDLEQGWWASARLVGDAVFIAETNLDRLLDVRGTPDARLSRQGHLSCQASPSRGAVYHEPPGTTRDTSPAHRARLEHRHRHGRSAPWAPGAARAALQFVARMLFDARRNSESVEERQRPFDARVGL
jgi:hypothetical protein